MRRLHLWKDDLVRSGDSVTVGVTIEDDSGVRRKLWHRIPSRFAKNLTESYNPFVVGTIFAAMRESSDIVVHGEVSRKLLENLEEFQAVWARWRPETYTRIEITADSESDDFAGRKSDSAMAAFSAGVDSSFTVYSHNKGLCGRLNRDIRTGMFIHGFNIVLDREDIFKKAAYHAEMMMNSLGIDLMLVATNFRDLGAHFGDSHAAEIASCVLMFENSYSTCLIASSKPYEDLTLPWGSNPITDRLLSTDRLEFVHDGATHSRCEKVEVLSDWQEARKYLRVCWKLDNLEKNCCVCEKCIRTILNFRVLDKGLPECFEHDVSDSRIAAMKGLNPSSIDLFEEILQEAEERSVTGSWVSELRKSVKRNRRASTGWQQKVHDMRNRYAVGTRLRRKLSGN